MPLLDNSSSSLNFSIKISVTVFPTIKRRCFNVVRLWWMGTHSGKAMPFNIKGGGGGIESKRENAPIEGIIEGIFTFMNGPF